MTPRLRAIAAVACLLVLATATPDVGAQNSRDAERKLERARNELKAIAAERRKLEGERGAAARELRKVDEQVGATSRELEGLQARITEQQAELDRLQVQRAGLRERLAAQRAELSRLVRAAYTLGDDAPLKLLLAQDRIADGQRLLAYHRYLQRERAARIGKLADEMRGLATLEERIQAQRTQLEGDRARRKEQLAQLERDRQKRAATTTQLESRYRDRATREKALGRDVKGLERLLADLRAAAARAARERAAAAAAAARARAAAAKPGARPLPPATPAPAPTGAVKVGGLGWPLSGGLLAGYGGTLPDGRKSQGVLIAAEAGSPVKAAAAGRVVFSDWMNGYGLILIIDHGDGYMSLYAHNDALLRDAGDTVARGDAVARVGNSGGQGRSALYFELRRNGAPVDPKSWLERR